jgi:hypothetical protein
MLVLVMGQSAGSTLERKVVLMMSCLAALSGKGGPRLPIYKSLVIQTNDPVMFILNVLDLGQLREWELLLSTISGEVNAHYMKLLPY